MPINVTAADSVDLSRDEPFDAFCASRKAFPVALTA